ncbi:MAG: hypothetical protein WBA74_15535 [Cyclobacteriaceae bacterium]
MSLIKSFSIILFVTFLFSSCGSGTRESVYKDECGSLKTFTVDEAYCEKYGLTVENFTITYPDQLEMETQADYRSSNYASFFKYSSDSIMQQSLNIGFYNGVSESGEDSFLNNMVGVSKKSLLQSLASQFRAQGFDLQDVTMQDENIFGEEHFTLRGKLAIDNVPMEYKGNYLMQMVMVGTADDRGILLIMAGRDDSGITTFEDFESKGCLHPIIHSLIQL